MRVLIRARVVRVVEADIVGEGAASRLVPDEEWPLAVLWSTRAERPERRVALLPRGEGGVARIEADGDGSILLTEVPIELLHSIDDTVQNEPAKHRASEV